MSRSTVVGLSTREVRASRLGRGWTQADLATRAGLSRQLISRAEGGRPISIEAAGALARVLCVSLKSLLADFDGGGVGSACGGPNAAMLMGELLGSSDSGDGALSAMAGLGDRAEKKGIDSESGD